VGLFRRDLDTVEKPRVGRGDVLLVVLAVLTALLVVRALRTTPLPALASSGSAPVSSPSAVTAARSVPSAAPSAKPAAPRPATTVALAASDGTVLRWSGGDCELGKASAVARRAAGSTVWQSAPVPLSTVAALALNGRYGIATGLDRLCVAGTVYTGDGGRTWSQAPVKSLLTSAARGVDGTVWTVRGDLLRYDAAVANGCRAESAGPASLVAATVPNAVWLLCQDDNGGNRLLLRSRDGGRTWQRLAGRRAETGLAGPGRIETLTMAAPGVGTALIRGGACPGGELRTSRDLGAHWSTQPCFDGYVLAVASLSANDLLLYARGTHGPVAYTSADGGRTWRAAA
jgi:photosystem II stability/assembly factor-like uncharacterized protein